MELQIQAKFLVQEMIQGIRMEMEETRGKNQIESSSKRVRQTWFLFFVEMGTRGREKLKNKKKGKERF